MSLYRAHVAATLIPLLRTPAYWVPLVLFPTLLYGFFGLAPSRSNAGIGNVLLASWSAFAIIGIAFFQFGVSIAQARESKWEDFARTLPAGAAPKLFAQIISAMLFAGIALALLWTFSRVLGASDLSPAQYLRLGLTLMGGAVPFVLMGATLGYLVPPRGAVPIANLLHLPMAYFGGLWLPPHLLPDAVAAISPYTPTRPLGELAWAAVRDAPVPIESLRTLGLYSLGFAIAAVLLWRRDEGARAR